ncbi:hypothetical protein BGX31_006360 [Mortierella sp. GBA43]|nr:hypothetical protein BGX31_006360 [Mortierella sp. GBA43]
MLIKDLYYDGEVSSQYDSIECPNLRHLSVFDAPQNSDIVLTLRIPTGDLHNLSRLDLDGIRIAPSNEAQFWDLCTRLEWLHMRRTFIPELPHTSIIFERMKNLHLSLTGHGPKSQIQWVAQCPNLEGFNWSSRMFGNREALKDFTALMSAGAWSKLSELQLDVPFLSDTQLATVIGGMCKTTKLDILTSEFGELSTVSLRCHFPTLRHLSISIIRNGIANDSIVAEILTSCPQLEHLCVNIPLGEEIIDGPPWVCERSMRIFQVPLMITPGQDSDLRHRAFFRRLSNFVNLECLSMFNRRAPRDHEEYLCLQLEKGLGQLSTLGKLRILGLSNDSKMGSIDLEWMLQKWKSLRTVLGCMNRDNAINNVLEEILLQSGIDYRKCTALKHWYDV